MNEPKTIKLTGVFPKTFRVSKCETGRNDCNFEYTDEKKKVLFTIENDNYPKQTTDKSGSGIGLQNLEKRLQLLYPNAYLFETRIENNRFLVKLELETV